MLFYNRKELTTEVVRSTLLAIASSVGIIILMFAMLIGAGVGAMIGAVALPLKILDGRIIDAPEVIKDIFADRDEI